jgi:calcium uniporter protein, mitochondrial
LEKKELEKQLDPLVKLKQVLDNKAKRHSELLVYGGFFGLMAQWLTLGRLTWWEYSWDVIEPITWFVNMGNSILAYTFFIVYRKDFTYESLSSLTVSKRQMALYKNNGLDVEKYVQLTKKIQDINTDIEKTQEEYV